ELSALNGADIVILPEMFNCPYANEKFVEYAEERDDSITLDAISKAAKENNVLIVAGSIPELDDNKIYNSSFTFDTYGRIINQYRKMHLFDIDTSQVKFKESDVLTAGNHLGMFDTDFAKIGIAICYDMRFGELFRLMALKGAQLIIVPGAFNMDTGPAHWEVLTRCRAIDNQIFVAAASTARNEDLSYVAYGNSMIAGPWGDVLARADKNEDIIYADIDLNFIGKVRRELPILKNRRNDIYDTIEKNKD
ncbi:MAG: carbon-nitrogen hydrolase family protein, partial [Methanobacterium sp.]